MSFRLSHTGLDWSLHRINEYKRVCWVHDDEGGKHLNPVTNKFIFATRNVGMSRITVNNAEEFYPRVLEADLVLNEDTDVTLDDVVRHIGLATNAAIKTRAKFKSDLIQQIEKHAKALWTTDERKRSRERFIQRMEQKVGNGEAERR